MGIMAYRHAHYRQVIDFLQFKTRMDHSHAGVHAKQLHDHITRAIAPHTEPMLPLIQKFVVTIRVCARGGGRKEGCGGGHEIE
jgi:hypothetical protein